MKNVLTVAAALLFSTILMAQRPQQGMRSQQGKPGMAQRGQGGMQGIPGMKDLNLSEAQQQQMKTLQADFRKKMQALNKNEGITVKEQRDQRFAMAKAHKQQVEQILTPEQKATLAQKRSEQQQKMQQRNAQRWEKMAADLQLTDAQKKSLTEARIAHQSKMQQLRQNDKLSRTEKQAAIQAEMQKHRQAMKNTLTDAQRSQLREMRSDKPGPRGQQQSRPGHGRMHRGAAV